MTVTRANLSSQTPVLMRLLPPIVAVLVLFPSLQIGLVGDDWRNLETAVEVSPAAVIQDLGNGSYSGPHYRPMEPISFRVDRALWHTSIRGYHITNIAMHALSAWVVARISFMLGASLATGAVAGVLFAIHPLSANAVAWLSARTVLLVCLFVLLSLWCYLEYRARRDCRFLALSLGCFLVALLSKEQAFAFPLILTAVVLGNNPLRAGFIHWFAGASRAWRDVLPFLVVSCLVLVQVFRSGKAIGTVEFVRTNEANALTFADRIGASVFTALTAVGVLDGGIRDWFVSVGSQLLVLIPVVLAAGVVAYRVFRRCGVDMRLVVAVLWLAVGVGPCLLLFPTAMELQNLYFAVPVIAVGGAIALRVLTQKNRSIGILAGTSVVVFWVVSALHIQHGWMTMGRFNHALHTLLREPAEDGLVVVINAPDPFRIASDVAMSEILLTFRIGQSARQLGGWSAQNVDFVHRELVQIVAVESRHECRYDSVVADDHSVLVNAAGASHEHGRSCLSALRFMHFAGDTGGTTREVLTTRVPFRRDGRPLSDGTRLYWFDGTSLRRSNPPQPS